LAALARNSEISEAESCQPVIERPTNASLGCADKRTVRPSTAWFAGRLRDVFYHALIFATADLWLNVLRTKQPDIRAV
jgi:hypothetical protein